MTNEPQIRVAVVGTGLAGLVTAYLLSHDEQNRYAVTLLEKGDRPALDYASVSVQDDAGRFSRVDLPMRAFADGYYAQLKALYDHIGVPYHAQKFLFAFSQTRDAQLQLKPATYFIHASNVHVFPPVRPREVSLLYHIFDVLLLSVCYLWLTVCFFTVEPRGSEDFGQYLTRIHVPWYFITHYILPLMCSVSTCTADALLRFPATDIVGYKRKTHRKDHYVVSGGVHSVQERLIEGLDVVFGAPVERVEPDGLAVAVSWRSMLPDVADQDSGNALITKHFDRVVLAVAPDVVGQIFTPLQAAMRRIPTVCVESVLLQPSDGVRRLRFVKDKKLEKEKTYVGTRKRRGDTAEVISLNSIFPRGPDPQLCEAMNMLESGARVATGPFSNFDDGEVLHRFRWTRAVRSVEGRRILNEIFRDGPGGESDGGAGTDEKHGLLRPSGSWRNGDDNVWLAGGWCWDGMVLLEGCVVSATRIAKDFGVSMPWLRNP